MVQTVQTENVPILGRYKIELKKKNQKTKKETKRTDDPSFQAHI